MGYWSFRKEKPSCHDTLSPAIQQDITGLTILAPAARLSSSSSQPLECLLFCFVYHAIEKRWSVQLATDGKEEALRFLEAGTSEAGNEMSRSTLRIRLVQEQMRITPPPGV